MAVKVDKRSQYVYIYLFIYSKCALTNQAFNYTNKYNLKIYSYIFVHYYCYIFVIKTGDFYENMKNTEFYHVFETFSKKRGDRGL